MGARRIGEIGARRVVVRLDSEPIEAVEGEPVAAALLAAGVGIFGRSVKYHRPRGAPCGTGSCAHCLMRVGGRPNIRTCLTPCEEGLVLERQNVLGGAERDLLAATDWFFPRGLDHHEMFTGVPLIQGVVQRVVRKVAGLGRLPDEVRRAVPAQDKEVDVLVVGGGRSGAAAARSAATAGARTVLVESKAQLEQALGDEPNLEVWTEATASVAEQGPQGLLVVVEREGGLVRIRPRATVFATGGYPTPGAFENNDLPGVMDARWALQLVRKWSVLPGERIVLCCDSPADQPMTEAFEKAGAQVVASLPSSAARLAGGHGNALRVVSVGGNKHVESVDLSDGREIPCDLVVIALPRAPAFELAANAGVSIRYEPCSGGFLAVADDDGRTNRDDVFVCGTLRGARGDTAAAGGSCAGTQAAVQTGVAHAS